jgi:transcriptional regulator with XRE-family HTH domain
MSELFSERLFSARRASGKKSKEIAEDCGISAAYYSQIESARRGTPSAAGLKYFRFLSFRGLTPNSGFEILATSKAGQARQR